jgi:DNA-binding LacI/PurR family transcriptional regulator
MSRRLAEVARKVGVSEATVSRVLNEKPGVADATRQAVLTALDVLGYERPTKLRGERARLVGLVLPELQNPIFPAFAEVMGAAFAQRGFTPVLCTQTAGGVSEADYVDLLLQQQVSGIVFVGGLYAQEDASHEHYARLHARRLPTVLVNAVIANLGFPCVSCDDSVAIEQAMGHLVSLGHTRIGLLIGPPDHVPAWSPTRSPTRSTRWRRHRLRRCASWRPASQASCVPATRWPWARSGLQSVPAWTYRRTSRWSASTTRR